MNTKQRVKSLLSEWQSTLHLEEWHIHLRLYQRLPLDDQYCSWNYSEKATRIGININRPLAEIEHDLAHELMHLVLAIENRCFDNLNKSKVSKKEQTVNESEYNLCQNVVIEHLLRILYGLLEKEYPPHKE